MEQQCVLYYCNYREEIPIVGRLIPTRMRPDVRKGNADNIILPRGITVVKC
jgi:hypothetical protein